MHTSDDDVGTPSVQLLASFQLLPALPVQESLHFSAASAEDAISRLQRTTAATTRVAQYANLPIERCGGFCARQAVPSILPPGVWLAASIDRATPPPPGPLTPRSDGYQRQSLLSTLRIRGVSQGAAIGLGLSAIFG